MTRRGMLVVRTGALAGLLTLAACGGSSGGPSVAQPSSDPATPAPITSVAALQAHPAPAGFPAGDYARIVKLQGDIDGRWKLLLKADGRYQFTDPENRPLDGTFDVTGTRIVWHDAECGDGTYVFTKTAAGLSFAEVAPDACAENRHALLAGHEWTKQS